MSSASLATHDPAPLLPALLTEQWHTGGRLAVIAPQIGWKHLAMLGTRADAENIA